MRISFPSSDVAVVGSEPVTNLGIGHHVLRRSGVVAQLLAQLPDERAKILQFAAVLGPPNGAEYTSVSQRNARVRHQEVEQLELLRSQMNRLSRSLHRPHRRIEFYFSDSNRRGFLGLRRLGPPYRGAKPRRQVPDGERL